MIEPSPQSSAVTRKIAANALAKLQAGKSISASEREALEQIEREQAAAKNPAPKRSSFGDAFRWTVDRGSIELSIDTKTLTARLRRANVLPGEDGKYSTAQIAGAVYGDHKLELIRGAQQENEMREVELARMRREVVPVEVAFQTVSNMLFAVRRVILTSRLSKEEQDACLKELAELNPSDFVTDKETTTKGTK